MLQFWAILKDSFREAIDGFVIYVMLGLSALVILVCASLSFTPEPPDQAFDKITKSFNLVFAEKGRSRVIGMSSNKYKASDVQPIEGGYKFRLSVTADAHATVNDKPDLSKGDSFRQIPRAE